MTRRQQIEERRRQWAEFNRWESKQPPIDRSPAAILADLGTVWSWLPAEERTHDPDPEKLGIQAMRRALGHLKGDL